MIGAGRLIRAGGGEDFIGVVAFRARVIESRCGEEVGNAGHEIGDDTARDKPDYYPICIDPGLHPVIEAIPFDLG